MGPTGGERANRRPTWRERYAGQPRASKRLDFHGHEVRVHVDAKGALWFVLVDIFNALEKRKTWPLRKRITDPNDIMLVLAWVPNAATPAGGGRAMIQATNLSGLEAMLTFSSLTAAPELLRWAQCVTPSQKGEA